MIQCHLLYSWPSPQFDRHRSHSSPSTMQRATPSTGWTASLKITWCCMWRGPTAVALHDALTSSARTSGSRVSGSSSSSQGIGALGYRVDGHLPSPMPPEARDLTTSSSLTLLTRTCSSRLMMSDDNNDPNSVPTSLDEIDEQRASWQGTRALHTRQGRPLHPPTGGAARSEAHEAEVSPRHPRPPGFKS